MRYDGYNGDIEVNERELTIVREGMVARATFGKVEPRVVPLVAVAGVHFTPATRLKNGYLRVLLAGEEHSPEIGAVDAVSHSNAVVFTFKANEGFSGLAGWLHSVAGRNHADGLLVTVAELAASSGSTGRLDKLAQTMHAKTQGSAGKVTDALAKTPGSISAFKSAMAASVAHEAGLSTHDAILSLQSHDQGRNAVVALFADRIERAQPKSFGSLSRANQDVEMTPIRAVSSVQAKKDGLRTRVIVYASGNNIEFRFAHDDAARFKAELQKLMLQGPAPAAAPAPAVPAPAPAPPVDVADQLAKFAALKQQGVLTDEEFAAQKAKLLGL